MNFSKNRLTCKEARARDLVSYLAQLGHEPAMIRGHNYWYLSPLRTERTPSFKVDRPLNCWYDHGIGVGGDLIDFGIRYHDCSIPELLHLLNGDGPFIPVALIPHARPSQPALEVLTTTPITSPELLLYLQERKIHPAIAATYCQEVRYRFNGKTYYAIGFKNDQGGYELRNRYFKGSSSPKTVTTLRNKADTLCVFEGFFDFLSFLQLPHLPDKNADYLILNSLAFFATSLPFMQTYERVRLWLDNDLAGRTCIQQASSRSSVFTDESGYYQGVKDLNDWLCQQ